MANKFVFHGKGSGVKVFIAISVAVFAFSALFLKVERCQKDSGGDYSLFVVRERIGVER